MHVPFSRSVVVFVRGFKVEKERLLSGWCFSSERWDMIKNEGFDWECHYAPVDLKGVVVLDVGAGQGETARFFLSKGAKCVVCVECDPDMLKFLRVNARLHRELVVVPVPFDLSMLGYPFDFLKMDIEGYEQILLDKKVVLDKPAVFEVHGLQLRDRFVGAGFRVERHVGCGWWTCYAFWKC